MSGKAEEKAVASGSKEHKQILAHCKEMLEYQNGLVAIHPT
jgi:hypothetical protein